MPLMGLLYDSRARFSHSHDFAQMASRFISQSTDRCSVKTPDISFQIFIYKLRFLSRLLAQLSLRFLNSWSQWVAKPKAIWPNTEGRGEPCIYACVCMYIEPSVQVIGSRIACVCVDTNNAIFEINTSLERKTGTSIGSKTMWQQS